MSRTPRRSTPGVQGSLTPPPRCMARTALTDRTLGERTRVNRLQPSAIVAYDVCRERDRQHSLATRSMGVAVVCLLIAAVRTR